MGSARNGYITRKKDLKTFFRTNSIKGKQSASGSAGGPCPFMIPFKQTAAIVVSYSTSPIIHRSHPTTEEDLRSIRLWLQRFNSSILLQIVRLSGISSVRSIRSNMS